MRQRKKCRNCGKRMEGPTEFYYRVCCKKCSDEYEKFIEFWKKEDANETY